jgi:alpha-N-arabinofuranosidase
MYVPFQDAVRLPVDFAAGAYKVDSINLPRLDAVAAKGKDGNIYVAITNIDPKNAASVDIPLDGYSIASVNGETLYASSIDAVNTFDNPDNVSPKAIDASVSGSKISVTVQPESLTVLAIALKK